MSKVCDYEFCNFDTFETGNSHLFHCSRCLFSSQLSGLRFLNLGFNSLSGTVGSNLQNLSALRSLFLNNNELSGSLIQMGILKGGVVL